jgi:hypothetical protein
MKHWKKTAPGKGNAQGRSVYLRYYCPAPIRPSTGKLSNALMMYVYAFGVYHTTIFIRKV